MEFIKDAILSGKLSKDLSGDCKMKIFSVSENKISTNQEIIIKRFNKIKKKSIFGKRGRK